MKSVSKVKERGSKQKQFHLKKNAALLYFPKEKKKETEIFAL